MYKFLKIAGILIATMLFYPALGLLGRFSGSLTLEFQAARYSPRFIISHSQVERLAFEKQARDDLLKSCCQVDAGGLKLRLAPDLDCRLWRERAELIVSQLESLLPGKPPMPDLETRNLYDNYGRFDNFFTVAVDPAGDEPFRTLAHELTHLFLLWALIPGLPVDCPRWLNEGLAEHVSGRQAGDSNGLEQAMFYGREEIAPLYVVSPAFSWSDRHVEWLARDAVALLLEQHGEDVFRRLINGLRYARPFISVYPIVTGRSFESFENEWLTMLQNRRLADNLTHEELASRTTWIAADRRFVELSRLLDILPDAAMSKSDKKRLTDFARLNEARRLMAAGEAYQAMGWLNGVASSSKERHELQTRLREIIESELPAGKVVNKPIETQNQGGSPEPGLVSLLLAWVIAISASIAAFKGYSLMRRQVLPVISGLWKNVYLSGNSFRWLVTGITGLAGSWFLKFLIISMIPYSGIAALPELIRVALAEAAAVTVWLGLAWQLRRWSNNETVPNSDLRSEPVSSWYKSLAGLAAISSFPPLMSAWQNNWQRPGFVWQQTVAATIFVIAGAVAFSLSVWAAAAVWNRTGRVSHLFPAVIYALFRGGLFADPFGSIFALAAGYRISQMLAGSASLCLPLMADVALTMPGVLICAGWFPAVDPVAGFWYAGSGVVLWWLAAAIAVLFWLRPAVKPVQV